MSLQGAVYAFYGMLYVILGMAARLCSGGADLFSPMDKRLSMTDISLREYIVRLENRLAVNAADEVIQHCRHILTSYPKNIAVYRLLGRALLMNGRWDEAGAVFRRVLSVIPDDLDAHIGLSEIYDHQRKPDEAIWHAERAFEVNPNDGDLVERIRSLYRRFRSIDAHRVQLTLGAAARLEMRSGKLDHAIETLRNALDRMPDRVDLRLLLAQALWAIGDRVGAAENALDVVQILPDCLEANRILTQLWLDEDRPSDAQRYLNRLEALDPYSALEIARGETAPADAFRARELDPRLITPTAVVIDRPAWLQDIKPEYSAQDTTSEAESTYASGLLSSKRRTGTGSLQAPPAEAETPSEPPELFTDDWNALVRARANEAETFEEDEIPPEFAFPSPTALGKGKTGELAETEPASDEIPPEFEDEDPLAWLRDTGIEITEPEENPFAKALNDTTGSLRIDPEALDPLAWLQDYEDEFLSQPPEAQVETELSDHDAVEFAPDAEPWFNLNSQQNIAPFTGEEQALLAEEAANELPAWMRTPNSFIEDDMDDEAAETEAAGAEDDPEALVASFFGESSAESSPPSEFPTYSTGELKTLFGESDFEAQSQEFTQTGDAQDPSAMRTVETPITDYNTADQPTNAESEAEWLASLTDQPPAVPGPKRGLTAMLNDPHQNWMNSSDDSSDEEQPQDSFPSGGALDDWLSQFGSSEFEPSEEDETPEWLSEIANEGENAQSQEEPLLSGETPDWLQEMGQSALSAETPSMSAEDELPFEDAGSESEPESAEEEAVPAEELSDWLTEAAPPEASAGEKAADEPAPAIEDWIAELDPDAASEAFDSSLQEEDAAFEFSPAEASLESIRTDEFDKVDVREEMAVPSDTFAGFEIEDEFEAVDELEALNEAEEWIEASGEAAAIDAQIPGEFYLLAQEGEPAAQPGQDIPEGAGETSHAADDFDWDAVESGMAGEPSAAGEEEVPDWLAEIQANQAQGVGQPEEDEEGTLETTGEAAAIDAELPGWEAQLEVEREGLRLQDETEEDDLDWLNEGEDDLLATAPIVGSEPVEASAVTPEELAAGDEALEFIPAENAPDWLNAMVPGIDVDYTAADDPDVISEEGEEVYQPEYFSDIEEETMQAAPTGASHGFGWLTDLVEEEARTAEEGETVAVDQPRPRFVFSRRPAWLAKLASSRPEPARGSAVRARDDDFPDWPNEGDDAPAASGDLPDWLR